MEEGILTAKASLDSIRNAKAWVDTCGHYSRPDIFDFRVHGKKMIPGQTLDVTESKAPEPAVDIESDQTIAARIIRK